MAAVGFTSAWLAVEVGRPAFGILVTLPVVGLGAISLPETQQLASGLIALVLFVLALGILSGVQDEESSLGLAFELRRALKALPLVALITVLLYFASRSNFLFPPPIYDPAQEAKKPKTIPLSEVEDRVLFTVEAKFSGPWKMGSLDVYDARDGSWRLPPFADSELERGSRERDRERRPHAGGARDVHDPRSRRRDPSRARRTRSASSRSVRRCRTTNARTTSACPRAQIQPGFKYIVASAQIPTIQQLNRAGADYPGRAQAVPRDPGAAARRRGAAADARPKDKLYDRLDYLKTKLLRSVTASGAGTPVDVQARQGAGHARRQQGRARRSRSSPQRRCSRGGPASRRASATASTRAIRAPGGTLEVRPRHGALFLEVYFNDFGWQPVHRRPAAGEGEPHRRPAAVQPPGPGVEGRRRPAVRPDPHRGEAVVHRRGAPIRDPRRPDRRWPAADLLPVAAAVQGDPARAPAHVGGRGRTGGARRARVRGVARLRDRLRVPAPHGHAADVPAARSSRTTSTPSSRGSRRARCGAICATTSPRTTHWRPRSSRGRCAAGSARRTRRRCGSSRRCRVCRCGTRTRPAWMSPPRTKGRPCGRVGLDRRPRRVLVALVASGAARARRIKRGVRIEEVSTDVGLGVEPVLGPAPRRTSSCASRSRVSSSGRSCTRRCRRSSSRHRSRPVCPRAGDFDFPRVGRRRRPDPRVSVRPRARYKYKLDGKIAPRTATVEVEAVRDPRPHRHRRTTRAAPGAFHVHRAADASSSTSASARARSIDHVPRRPEGQLPRASRTRPLRPPVCRTQAAACTSSRSGSWATDDEGKPTESSVRAVEPAAAPAVPRRAGNGRSTRAAPTRRREHRSRSRARSRARSRSTRAGTASTRGSSTPIESYRFTRPELPADGDDRGRLRLRRRAAVRRHDPLRERRRAARRSDHHARCARRLPCRRRSTKVSLKLTLEAGRRRCGC